MAAQPKISVYSLADLKNTSDDAIPNYLNSLKFKQIHTLADVRLALGYSAFLISAACFYWDWKLGFDDTKYYTAAAVALYACLNGALTFWIWAVEKGTIYAGMSPDGDKIEISTSTKKHVPIYNVLITYYPKSSPNTPQTIKISRPFTQWFDSVGHFVALPFQQMFAGEVAIIGKADPMKAVTAPGKAQQGQSSTDSETLNDTLAKLMASGNNYDELLGSADTSVKKTSKGKKKA